MIDFLDNRLGKALDASTRMNDIDAWIDLNTPRLKAKLIRDWIQKDQLMEKGVDADGKVIGLYSLATEFITEGRKPAGSRFNLFESGDLYASMLIVVLSDILSILADTSEIRDQEWFSNRILELTDENLNKYILEAKIGLQNYTRKVYGIA